MVYGDILRVHEDQVILQGPAEPKQGQEPSLLTIDCLEYVLLTLNNRLFGICFTNHQNIFMLYSFYLILSTVTVKGCKEVEKILT